MSPRVAAVVVNWRLPGRTIACLRSLEALATPCRAIVVDNGSGDGSAAAIAAAAPGAELIALPANLGFGAACNRAIALALRDPGCEAVLLLNNDATIEPGALAALLAEAAAHPEVGILGPKVRSSRDRRLLWYAGARRRRLVLAAAAPGRGRADAGAHEAPRAVDYVFGAAMLIRRPVLERVGGFDERYFLYLEDLDLCLRAQRAGFGLRYVPAALVWHEGSASTASDAGLRRFHYARSTALFLRRHLAGAALLPALAFWGLVALRAAALDLARGDLAALGDYAAGLRDGLRAARAGGARYPGPRTEPDAL
ncbi:MAG TPA: glycosyltransferase family 2 protein [Chloroflexaceae bacterium]|nr:glycosyltransferase family 2 protein [Chloroflexaceae bacterium]